MTPPTPAEHITQLLEEFGPLPATKLLRIFARRQRRAVMHAMDGMLKAGRVGLDEHRRLVITPKGTVGRHSPVGS